MRRIAEASSAFYKDQIEAPLLHAGMTEAEVLLAANEAVAAGIPHLDQAVIAMYHAHAQHTWMANVVESVEVTLEKQNGGTMVVLRHYGLPDEGQQDHHRKGWEAYLPRLAHRILGDDPGPDPNA